MPAVQPWSEVAEALTRVGGDVACVYVGLLGLRAINLGYSHEAGERMLKAVPRRLRDAVNRPSRIARVGDDRFVVVVRGQDWSSSMLEEIVACLREPVEDEHGEPIRVRAAFGVALGAASDAVALLEGAEEALSEASARGAGTIVVADERSAIAARHEAQIVARLDEAVTEVTAHYQPVVDLISGEIAGFEALARWHSASLGDVAPSKWIPLAEQNGQIHAIGRAVLEQSLDVVRGWIDAGVWNGRTMAVNVSPVQLMDSEFVGTVLDALSERDLASSTLILELTETNPVSEFSFVGDRLRNLREHGVRIALDDFGTGSSNFEQLRELPFDMLKIDRRFISGMLTSPLNRAIVRSVVTVAGELGLEVIAEGVETIEQHHALMRKGVVRAQGFLYAGARPAAEALAALQLPTAIDSGRTHLPDDEQQRLNVVRSTRLLDTPAEPEFDRIVQEAATLCNAPMALISLIDEDRQWFKARVGVDICETAREDAVCAVTIRNEGIFEVCDLRRDDRFNTTRLVATEDGLRAYAGVAIRTDDGFALGALCVADRVPRLLSATQRDGLLRLGQQVSALVSARRHLAESRSCAIELERLRTDHGRLLRRSAAVLDAIDVGVIVAGADGRVEALSPHAQFMIDPSARGSVGSLVWDLFDVGASGSGVHVTVERWFRAAVDGTTPPRILDISVGDGLIQLSVHAGSDGSGEVVLLARRELAPASPASLESASMLIGS